MRDRAPPASNVDDASVELAQLFAKIFDIRVVATTLISLILVGAFLLWEPERWKLAWVGVTAALLITLSVVEALRMRRHPVSSRRLQVNLVLTLLGVGSYVYITGGIESPMVAVFLPMGIVAGFVFQPFSSALPVPLAASAVIVLFAAGATGGWLPRATPEFFALGPGFWDRPVYVWLTAALLLIPLAISTAVGAVARRRMSALTEKTLDAQAATLESVLSRNHELFSVSATIAHELKNPLASIQGLTQLLRKGAPEASKERRHLEVMLKEIQRMSTVVEELRNFTRPLSGLNLRRVNLTRLVREVCDLNEGIARSRGITIVVTGPSLLEADCDPQKIKQALINLLQNALEASDDLQEIALCCSRAVDGPITISITDEGSGLDPAAAEHLFRPGFTTKETGSGIGLVVARAIVEQHRGRLTLAGRPDRGCEAVIALPTELRPALGEVA